MNFKVTCQPGLQSSTKTGLPAHWFTGSPNREKTAPTGVRWPFKGGGGKAENPLTPFRFMKKRPKNIFLKASILIFLFGSQSRFKAYFKKMAIRVSLIADSPT